MEPACSCFVKAFLCFIVSFLGLLFIFNHTHTDHTFQETVESKYYYNYACASEEAKVLFHNKEAKGASNVLIENEDKYLLNPCSAKEKFLVIELSEETLVEAIEIANFERHSSNLKHFELLGSQDYPDDDVTWIKFGDFTAKNVKRDQRFVLPEAKWARYVKLNLISHYGSQYYCTMSVVRVHGVGAIEKLVEELISMERSNMW